MSATGFQKVVEKLASAFHHRTNLRSRCGRRHDVNPPPPGGVPVTLLCLVRLRFHVDPWRRQLPAFGMFSSWPLALRSSFFWARARPHSLEAWSTDRGMHTSHLALLLSRVLTSTNLVDQYLRCHPPGLTRAQLARPWPDALWISSPWFVSAKMSTSLKSPRAPQTRRRHSAKTGELVSAGVGKGTDDGH